MLATTAEFDWDSYPTAGRPQRQNANNVDDEVYIKRARVCEKYDENNGVPLVTGLRKRLYCLHTSSPQPQELAQHHRYLHAEDWLETTPSLITASESTTRTTTPSTVTQRIRVRSRRPSPPSTSTT